MRILAAVFVCLFFGLGALAQTDPEPSDAAQASVESITLFRDEGGEAGEETAVFLPTDVPLHCSIELTSKKAATVKMTLVAVKAGGLRPETKVVTVSYQTNGKQNIVNFTAAPEKTWAPGKYRVDVHIDGKLDKSKDFDVQKIAPKAAPKSENGSAKPKN